MLGARALIFVPMSLPNPDAAARVIHAADWPRVRALFDALVELPPAERDSALQASAASEAVRVEVRSLLAHRTDDDDQPDGFLATPALPAAARGAWAGDDAAEGRIGQRLDFGIAKALDPLEGGDADATLFGERPFMPFLASPEQVRGKVAGTATDIYSLDVLL